MSFASYSFIFLFLPVVVAAFWIVQRQSVPVALWLLSAASIVFYLYWNPRDLVVAGGSILLNYHFARLILLAPAARAGWLLTGAVTLNLFALLYYKYLDFLLGLGGIPASGIALPLGISFFTFTQIAYLADCRRGRIGPDGHNFRDYLLFVTFFPHLIAGPILHHADIIPQFHDRFRQDRAVKQRTGMVLFVIGLFKKAVVADSLASIVGPVFEAADKGLPLSAWQGWSGALGYSLQLYFDFSGYSDMAVGAALLLGMSIPFNFDSPYRATSIIAFWRRWHMSLSAFLRDYLYLPLGGNRRGASRTYANIFVTMLLGGIWHGAGINYVLWGGLHGVLIVINHLWRDFRGPRLPWPVGWGLTLSCVVVGFVFFRAASPGAAQVILSSMASPPDQVVWREAAMIAGASFLTFAGISSRAIHDRLLARSADQSWWVVGFACGAGAALSLLLVTRDSPFLYFQF